VTEGQIQAFMEQNTEVIPTPLLLGHDLQWNCVISQFEIDRANIADFAYITKNSGQWRFVFVEMERPQKRLFVDEPHVDFHRDTRQAIAQIEGWRSFAERNQETIVKRLAPLMQPREFWDNPIEIQYVLVIGRKPERTFPTPEHSGRVKRLAQDSRIHLCTYDSILRMGRSQGIGARKNVLSHWKSSYAIKVAQADTNIFGWYDDGQISIADEQAAWFKARGYDMDAWRNGERLVVNHKLPDSRMGEVFDEIIRDREEAAKKAAGTPPPHVPEEPANPVVAEVKLNEIPTRDGKQPAPKRKRAAK
jgi:hypothetical protein